MSEKKNYKVIHHVMDPSLKGRKREAIRIAKDLGYSNDVIISIQNAKNENEIIRIMITARKNLED